MHYPLEPLTRHRGSYQILPSFQEVVFFLGIIFSSGGQGPVQYFVLFCRTPACHVARYPGIIEHRIKSNSPKIEKRLVLLLPGSCIKESATLKPVYLYYLMASKRDEQPT
jgi:hypothetical protein